jgi:SAM-dependent methyltransferase
MYCAMQTRLALLAVALASCVSHPKGASTTKSVSAEQRMFSQADSYDRFMGRWSQLIAPSLVEFSQVDDVGAVLDVGSGTGALAFAVRDATTTTRVLGIDLSREYVSHAAAKSGDARVRFEVGDAQALHLQDASFDRTMSLLVLNFVPDRRRALAEMIRVTKPGGVLSAAVWEYGEGMEMLRVFWDEATALDPAIAPRDERHMPLCRQGELSAFFRAANLDAVAETALVATLRFASFDDYWEPFQLGQGPAGAYVAKLSSAHQARLRNRLRQRLLSNEANRPIELSARAWAAKGTVPPR